MTPHCRSRQEFIAYCRAANSAFLDTHRKRVYVEYVREHRQGKPTAVLVAYKTDNGTSFMGWSAVNTPIDEFSKPIGLWKAIRRATGQGRLTAKIPDRLLGDDKNLTLINSPVRQFLERAAKELSRGLSMRFWINSSTPVAIWVGPSPSVLMKMKY